MPLVKSLAEFSDPRIRPVVVKWLSDLLIRCVDTRNNLWGCAAAKELGQMLEKTAVKALSVAAYQGTKPIRESAELALRWIRKGKVN